MSEISKTIISWANRTDMETITVGMLKDWILEMELNEQINQQTFLYSWLELTDALLELRHLLAKWIIFNQCHMTDPSNRKLSTVDFRTPVDLTT